MSINIPEWPLDAAGYYSLPSDYATILEEAKTLLTEQTDESTEDTWTDAGINSEVQLHRKDNPDNAYDVPWVRGHAVIEDATPDEVVATIQVPDMRKKWDSRFDYGAAINRFDPNTYSFYSVMKSPSMFIWARDIAGVQRNIYDYPSKGDITIFQKTVDDEEHAPDAGSYAKSRTRATVELSAWVLRAKGTDTDVSYIVKVHLNGNIPTSVISMLATETPMCVGRVRDVLYSTGFAPYLLDNHDASKTILATMSFDDGDGTEATAGERKYTAFLFAQAEDTLSFRYDAKRMYPDGVKVSVEGEAADLVKAQTEGADLVKVSVPADAKGKRFELIIEPAA